MKNFLLFYGEQYYPVGGMGDFHDSFNTLEEAREVLVGADFDWFHVWSVSEGAVVLKNS